MSEHTDQHEPLDTIFNGLASRNEDERRKYAIELRNYIAGTVAEMSPDSAGKVWENVNQGLFDLMHSQHTEKKLGGLLAMDYLLQIEGEETLDSKRNLFRFYNYVKHLLPDPDVKLMLQASQTLGKIVYAASKNINRASAASGAFNESFMDHQVPAAINLIQPDRQESPRYAGVLILKELARNSPTYFYAHIGLVFDNILVPLRDQRVIVREAAAELLAACLEIVATREVVNKSPYLDNVLRDAQAGLRQAQPEIIHASLLAYRELLLRGGMFMRDVFPLAAEQILRFKSHRDPLIRKLVMTLIPDMFLKGVMGHLSTALEKPADRAMAFGAIGRTATFVKSDIKPYLNSTMQHIKQSLQAHKKKTVEGFQEGPIFECIAMLATAVGPALSKWLHDSGGNGDVLDLMFSCGLSEPLRDALVAITGHIPPFLKPVQERLLNLLSLNLCGKQYNPVGAPLPTRKTEHEFSPAHEGIHTEKNPEQIKLALSTLGSFNFAGHILNEFVRSCALPYLEEDNMEIRHAAAVTCCRLFTKDPIFYSSSTHAIQIISDVLDKLLTVAIADPEPSIRMVVLTSLHANFDKHLAQAENVRSLFIALNDEVFENRLAAVTLIGRLSKNNPAYVVPSLRKTLIQLLTELEYSTVRRNREECTSLLTMLVNVTQNFMKPYALPILAALMLKAHDPNPTVAANIIMCIGELTVVAGEDALPYVSQLMQVIITHLSDPSLVKRDAALHTLGQLCSSTGYVITPFIEHPQLLQLLGRILRTETTPIVQREVVKVLGIIGALDPYRRKRKLDENVSSETALTAVNQVALNLPNASTASDDYFQTVVMSALLAILKDVSLNNHHHTVIESIMSIFKTQGLKCVSFLPQVIPAFTAVTRSSPARLQEFHLQQLAILVGIIKQHVRNYTVSVFALVRELWENQTLQLPLVSLIEALGVALAADFKPLLPSAIPLILRAFDKEFSPRRAQTQIKIFDALQAFGSIIEEYLYLLIPVIVKTYERVDGTTALRKRAIQTIDVLTRHVNFSDHASRIIHPMVRVLNGANNELRVAVLDALCSLVVQLGSDFAVFVPMINQCLVRTKMSHPRYESLITKLLNGERLSQESTVLESLENSRMPEFSAPAEATKLIVNQMHLRQAWDVSQVITAADWAEWMRRLRLEFMKESPSHALRACMSLVDAHPPLAKELYNAAFLSCWTELYDQYQEELVASLESALESLIAPTEIIHSILDLAEFMEHQEKPLPIEHALISINTRLQQHDAAWGTLVNARVQYDITEHEEWFEKLGRWQEALQAYDKRAQEYPHSMETEIGRIKCLHALGEWDRLADQNGSKYLPWAAAAAWSLADWDVMEGYIASMKQNSADRHFYKAILAVHQQTFPKASYHIAKTRDLLHTEFTSFSGDGYGRSYNVMVRAQLLSELEEIIAYKKYADQPELRTLVINPEFANLCRTSNRMTLADKTLNSLLSPHVNALNAPSSVIYAQLKYMWANGNKQDSLLFLRQFTTTIADELQTEVNRQADRNLNPRVGVLSKLLARCYFKIGQWRSELRPNWTMDQHSADILNSFMFATHYDGEWYKAWHMWAHANFNVINSLAAQSQSRNLDISGNQLAAHAVQAINGFFRSISLRSQDALQDTSAAINGGFRIVDVDTWLDVIPQVWTPHANIWRDIHSILIDVGKHHPQALIYPLVVALSIAELVSNELIRVAILWHERWHEGLEEASRLYFTEKNADGMIAVLQPLHDLLDQGPQTARETSFAQVFGRELREARDACRRYRTYGDTSELDKAWDIILRCGYPFQITTGQSAESLRQVFKRVEKQLPQLTTLDLQYVSPRLLKARDLDLAVPGTYRSGQEVIAISKFSPKLSVIASKQRPRRLCMTGTDGRDYQYVLKVIVSFRHEDLRQDERVMQLFGLVNTLLSADSASFKRRLHIQRAECRILGWVQDSDTLHVLVRDLPEARKVVLNIEYRMMIQACHNMAPDYENLTLLQKIEVFEYALENTTGQDLYRVLWLKSVNSEHWLERRATYTRSLAVSSMVGHILGLGDRHPSNPLLERTTGKVIHIDYGDCFEIAMHREKFPEKIPFRLTRMLTHAMEVSGIEGSFRNTCEITMTVMRENQESLMAVLEAFIYDPLMNWRLTQRSPDMRRTDSNSRQVADLARVAVHPQAPTRKLKADENHIFSEAGGNPVAQEVRNTKALNVYNRVHNKLTGRDFDPNDPLTVPVQVEKLILQATSIENLCQCFSGWCAFW
ncbi:Serine/threonine-protein kinase TOR [Favolaschia claudopus]|uniref:Serine/threonine-protein kinase TOR n=1 Tax=Favolaschia claudopus TaxID=2862362 RepID=A0AAW0BG09_9AGAR